MNTSCKSPLLIAQKQHMYNKHVCKCTQTHKKVYTIPRNNNNKVFFFVIVVLCDSFFGHCWTNERNINNAKWCFS